MVRFLNSLYTLVGFTPTTRDTNSGHAGMVNLYECSLRPQVCSPLAESLRRCSIGVPASGLRSLSDMAGFKILDMVVIKGFIDTVHAEPPVGPLFAVYIEYSRYVHTMHRRTVQKMELRRWVDRCRRRTP